VADQWPLLVECQVEMVVPDRAVEGGVVGYGEGGDRRQVLLEGLVEQELPLVIGQRRNSDDDGGHGCEGLVSDRVVDLPAAVLDGRQGAPKTGLCRGRVDLLDCEVGAGRASGYQHLYAGREEGWVRER
jgi:hypothetical protein